MRKMNPTIKTAWVAKLRELPNERQGRGALYDTDTDQMCCLGVLCEMAVEEGVVSREVYVTVEENPRHLYRYGKVSTHLLPEDVCEWAGVNDNPHPKGAPAYNNMPLTWFNDNGGYNFDEIADIIEQSRL